MLDKKMTDENFEYIFSQIGKPATLRDNGASGQLPSGAGLPQPLIGFLNEFGRCQFLNGLLNAIYPDDLQSILDLIFEGDKDLDGKKSLPFAYSVFGSIYFWHAEYGVGDVNLVTGEVTCEELVNPNDDKSNLANTIYLPFLLEKESHDLFDEDDKPLFKRALKALGRVDFLECYGFVPALALGGDARLENLKKLSAPEHFAILAQLTEFTLMKSDGETESVAVRKIGR